MTKSASSRIGGPFPNLATFGVNSLANSVFDRPVCEMASSDQTKSKGKSHELIMRICIDSRCDFYLTLFLHF